MLTVQPKGCVVCPPLFAGSKEPKPSLVPIYVLVVLGTLLTALILGCLLKR